MEETETKGDYLTTEVIRAEIRNYAKQHRVELRSHAADALRFGLGEIREKIKVSENFNEKDVRALAQRCKRRKHATVEDMYRLSCAFLQEITLIRAFIIIPGAFQVLIKELTGSDSERVVAALECLCNLSLGEAHVCEKIANKAGSYLVTYLHCDDERLQRTTLWTMSNILNTGSKGAELLMKLELLPLLWSLYINENDSSFCADAADCLLLIATSPTQLLAAEQQLYIKQHMKLKSVNSVASEYHLGILFHSNILYSIAEELDLSYLLHFALWNLVNTQTFDEEKSRWRILYAIRVLGNLMSLDHLHVSLNKLFLQQLFILKQNNFIHILNHLFEFQNLYLTTECFWLLANWLRFQNSNPQEIENILCQLQIKLDIVMK